MSEKFTAILLLVTLFLPACLAGQEGPNLFGFSGHEYDSETGLYYMKGRYYDPETGLFLTRDPAAGELAVPMTLHPYIYALANPTVYVDPDGREVRLLDDESLQLIKNTLPKELQGAVQVGDDGLIQKEPLEAIESDNPNFIALRELVGLSAITAVHTAERVEFVNAEGTLVKEPFSFQTRAQVIDEMAAMGVSREQLERDIPVDQQFLFLGLLATPRDSENPFDDQATISLTGEATVTVANEKAGAPEVELTKTAAHELFGHALLFQQGKPFRHGDIPEGIFDEIERRTEDTYNRSLIQFVHEDPSSPGVIVEPEGKNEDQR